MPMKSAPQFGRDRRGRNPNGWVCSSAGEHRLHTAGVTGSIPVTPTIQLKPLAPIGCRGLLLSATLFRLVRKSSKTPGSSPSLGAKSYGRGPSRRASDTIVIAVPQNRRRVHGGVIRYGIPVSCRANRLFGHEKTLDNWAVKAMQPRNTSPDSGNCCRWMARFPPHSV